VESKTAYPKIIRTVNSFIGENGTGKSSITDSVEWFFKDEVKHLSGEEIELKEALRNYNISKDDESSITIEFTKSAFNATKSIRTKKDKLVISCTNDSEDFKKYLLQTQKENIILRHHLLKDFVIKQRATNLKAYQM
jgi:predicted ATP-dependent endonuclease of OLD family